MNNIKVYLIGIAITLGLIAQALCHASVSTGTISTIYDSTGQTSLGRYDVTIDQVEFRQHQILFRVRYTEQPHHWLWVTLDGVNIRTNTASMSRAKQFIATQVIPNQVYVMIPHGDLGKPYPKVTFLKQDDSFDLGSYLVKEGIAHRIDKR